MQDGQYSRVLRPVDECKFHSGQPVRKLHPVQSHRNTRVDFGHQDNEQIRPSRIAMRHAFGVQLLVLFHGLYSETLVSKAATRCIYHIVNILPDTW